MKNREWGEWRLGFVLKDQQGFRKLVAVAAHMQTNFGWNMLMQLRKQYTFFWLDILSSLMEQQNYATSCKNNKIYRKKQ